MTVGVQFVSSARAADVSQAAYFRARLEEEREQVAGDLARIRARMHECIDGEQVVGLRGMARLRSGVRELEARQRELHRMIAALDRRFSALWMREG